MESNYNKSIPGLIAFLSLVCVSYLFLTSSIQNDTDILIIRNSTLVFAPLYAISRRANPVQHNHAIFQMKHKPMPPYTPPVYLNESSPSSFIPPAVSEGPSCLIHLPVSQSHEGSTYAVEAKHWLNVKAMLSEQIESVMQILEDDPTNPSHIVILIEAHQNDENRTVDDAVHLHIMLLRDKGSYYYVEKPNNAFPQILIGNFSKHGYPFAIDKKLLESEPSYKAPFLCTLNANYMYFKAVQTSHFLHCDIEEGRAWMHANQLLPPSKSKQNSVRKILEHTKETFRQYNMTFQLGSGTLLGWYRECDVIPYTSDADVYSLYSEYNPDVYSFYRQGKAAPVQLIYRYGLEKDGLEFSLKGFGIKLDIFFLYKDVDEDVMFVGAISNTNRKFRYDFNVTEFDLCSGELLGNLYPVPCNALDVIRMEYSDDWDKVKREPMYDYRKGPRNVRDMGKFTRDEWKIAYQVFGTE